MNKQVYLYNYWFMPQVNGIEAKKPDGRERKREKGE